jgi:HK97 family phage prohead protease
MDVTRLGWRAERPPIDEFERRYGKLGAREIRTLPFVTDETRDSGSGGGQFTIRGHAAVFDQWSLDLGFFREKIDRAAFDSVLERNPDVFLLWDHDTRYTLARTASKSLELRIDPRGLHYWARVAPTSYAEDLRVLMERGDINQASFAFTVGRDEWLIETDDDGNENVSRTILEVADLFDVTVTAMGAYPQTDSEVVRAALAAYEPARKVLPASLVPADPRSWSDFTWTDGGTNTTSATTTNAIVAAGDASRDNAGAVNEHRKALAALRARSRRSRLLHQPR